MEIIKNFFSAAGQLIVDLFSSIGGFFKNVVSGTNASALTPAAPDANAAPTAPVPTAPLQDLVSEQDRTNIRAAVTGTKHTYRTSDQSWLPSADKALAATDRSYHPEIGTDAMPIFTQNEQGRLVVNMPQNARLEIKKLEMSTAMPGQDVQYNVLVVPSWGEMGAAQNPVNSKPTSFTAQSITVSGKMLEQAQMIINTPKIGENSIYAKRDDLAKGTTLIVQSEGAKVRVAGANYMLNGEFNDNPVQQPKPAAKPEQPTVVFVKVPDDKDEARKKQREHADERRARSNYSAPRSRSSHQESGGAIRLGPLFHRYPQFGRDR